MAHGLTTLKEEQRVAKVVALLLEQIDHLRADHAIIDEMGTLAGPTATAVPHVAQHLGVTVVAILIAIVPVKDAATEGIDLVEVDQRIV